MGWHSCGITNIYELKIFFSPNNAGFDCNNRPAYTYVCPTAYSCRGSTYEVSPHTRTRPIVTGRRQGHDWLSSRVLGTEEKVTEARHIRT